MNMNMNMIRTCHVGRRRNWLVAELVSVSGRKAEFGQSFVFVRALLYKAFKKNKAYTV